MKRVKDYIRGAGTLLDLYPKSYGLARGSLLRGVHRGGLAGDLCRLRKDAAGVIDGFLTTLTPDERARVERAASNPRNVRRTEHTH